MHAVAFMLLAFDIAGQFIADCRHPGAAVRHGALMYGTLS